MAVLDSEAAWYRSATHSTDDTSSTGGARSSTKIANTLMGEVFTRMTARTSGVIDVDIERQYQQAFGRNDNSSSSLLDALIYIANLLRTPAASGFAKFQGGSSSDGGTKKIKVWGVTSGNVLDTEELICAGTSLVTGAKNWNRILRTQCRKVSDSSPEVLVSDGLLYVGSENIGMIPGGFTWATGEVRLWVPGSTDSAITSINRKTAPAGWSGSQPNSRSNAISVRNDANNDTLGPTVSQAAWFELTLQPGMEPANLVDLVPVLEGDSTE